MPSPRNRLRPDVELLDARIVMATTTPVPTPVPLAAPTHLTPGQYPSANFHRPFTPADLQAYAAAYQSFLGASDFTPQYDFNGTGFIGQNDATPILRGLAAITPRIPLQIQLALAPGEQVKGHHPANSGGVTRLGVVTVIGKTTPNSIVFTDGPAIGAHSQSTGNFKFRGDALTSNAEGYFLYKVFLTPLSKNSLTGLNVLVRTPFGQQAIRAFPVFRIG